MGTIPSGARERARWWAAGRWALPLLVVVPMLALAGAVDEHAIIFPEGAALAMGVWVLGTRGWAASPWRIVALPSLGAALGVLLARSDLPLWSAAILGVTLALLLLAAADSRLAPALSAAVLPIVFGIETWSYPVAVTAICAVIVAGAPRLSPPPVRATRDEPTGRYPLRVAAGAWLVIAAWILVGGEALALSSVALAPPLFVSALEWLGRGGCTVAGALRRLALLTGAGLVGSVALEAVGAEWLAGSLAVTATLALMWLLATPHAPALAIVLLPQIVATPDPVSFTLAIAAGSAALYLGALAVADR